MATKSLPSLLLQLLFQREPLDEAQVATLGCGDWDTLMAMVGQHRLGPLLHWRLRREPSALFFPKNVRSQLESRFRKAALRALAIQGELSRLHGILHEAQIPYAALKGAYLAFHAYPHAALRPMRDVDVLVPYDRALEAFQLLLDMGYRRSSGSHHQGNPEAALRLRKHLPPLLSPSSRIAVELHHWLSKPQARHGAHRALGVDRSLWSRRIECASAARPIAFLSVTDLLLHLIVHAVYDDRFSNGPLIFSDLIFLLHQHPIDWPLFWQLSDRGGWTKGCLLLLKMAQRFDNGLPVRWAVDEPDPVSEDLLLTAEQLTLGDLDRRLDIRLLSESSRSGTGRTVSVLWSRAFPSRRVIASWYPVAEGSLAVYRYYPWHWARLLRERIPSYVVNRRNRRIQHEAANIGRLEQWLGDRH